MFLRPNTVMGFQHVRWNAAILFFVVLKSSTDGAMFCYHGKDVNSPDALQNETCLTKELHIPKNLMPDQLTSESPLVTNRAPVAHYAKYKKPQGFTPLCYIFRYIDSTSSYASEIQKKSVHIAFGCDFEHLCAKKELNKILRNGTSQLYCCYGNNCNTVDHLPHLAAENRICYHGTNNISDNPTSDVQSCTQPDVSCARKKIFLPHKTIEEYFCDNSDTCSEQMSSGAYKSCTNTTLDNTTQELCCCSKNNCFIPPWPVVPGNISINGSGSSFIEFPMKDSINKPKKKKRSTALITGMVAALVLMAGFAAGIAFVAACKRRKKSRRRRDPNVIMQYERLSVSEGEMDDAVVL